MLNCAPELVSAPETMPPAVNVLPAVPLPEMLKLADDCSRRCVLNKIRVGVCRRQILVRRHAAELRRIRRHYRKTTEQCLA